MVIINLFGLVFVYLGFELGYGGLNGYVYRVAEKGLFSKLISHAITFYIGVTGYPIEGKTPPLLLEQLSKGVYVGN